MFQTKKSNIKLTIDKKLYASIQKNVTETKPVQVYPSKNPSKCQKIDTTINLKLKTKQSEPILKQIPSLINQRKISDNQQLPNSAEQTKYYEGNSQLIQQLIQENIKLKKQNLAKDSIINQLITNNDTSKVNLLRASTSQTERNCHKLLKQQNNQKNTRKSMGELSSLGFTFCNTEQKNYQIESEQFSIKSSKSPIKLPKEFQIIPNQKKFFV
ncbi:unnamed protein product [Paramecium pentaurelia]|uniref:Uncharacterized protein n=1 Tax=Paramecium pentaurelia TaxID=43138 RepID=A0A8S1TF63_9CILI|nr:unnamed protein product [Paramecium pentaurelia]CAD8150568.1 unnamed protein product [Paramecium pentaurelia]